MPDESSADVLARIRQRSLELHTELLPLMKDVPAAGGVQKVARRAAATLELLDELCRLLERDVMPRLPR